MEDNKKTIEEIMKYFSNIFKQKHTDKNNLTMFDKIIIDSSNNDKSNDFIADNKFSIIKDITYNYLKKHLKINDIICFSIPTNNFVLHERVEEDEHFEENSKVVGFSKNFSIKLNYIDSDLPVYLTFDNPNLYVTGNIECMENITADLFMVNLTNKEKLKLCTFNGIFCSNLKIEDFFYEKDWIFLLKKSDF